MADFPGNIASDGSLFLLKNNVSTLLTSTITAGQMSITLSSSSPFPPVGYMTVDTEAILYSANATATGVITVATRGADSTTAAQHDAGAAVYHNFVAAHHNNIKDEVIAIESNLMTRYQTSFLAYNSASDLNVTGTGTQTTVDFDTEVFDLGANFSADTFTAPVTGKYQLQTNVYLEGLDTTHHSSLRLRIVTSNRVHVYQEGDIPAGVTNKTIPLSVLADMDLGDTAYVELLVSGATSTVDVYGSADGFTCFSGSLTN